VLFALSHIYRDMVALRVKEWQAKFGNLPGGKEIATLTGETSFVRRLVGKSDVHRLYRLRCVV
jgi:pre-mRNA-splicing helicase BRR2